uniref:DNA-directed RNA polymerase subunit beta' n=1 Tax=Dunaliella salina TaxID=3046 RepID=A0A1C8XRQ9_DUNSA|nr:beta' subunit of RNA polymerase [Dunaliella salina]
MNYFNSYGIRMLSPYIARIQKNIIFKDKIFYKKNFISSSKTKNYNNINTNGVSPNTEYSNNYASPGFGVRGTLGVPNSQKINFKENKKYNFKKRLYTSYSKFTEVKLVTIGIASPLRILQWAEKTLPNGKIYGEVLNANTLHHKTFKPQKGGLFCERIFGPLKDFECSCGKIDKTAKYSLRETEQKPGGPARNNNNPLEETIEDNNKPKKSLGELSFGVTKDKSKTTRKLRKFCPDCDVEYTWSVIRRYQLGYIKLISPVTHVWFLKGTPSYLSILLDIKKRFLQSITYCSETLTIEHSGSAASALQSYKISGGFVDLDSPSKIYASWSKAKSMATISNENSDINAAESNSEKLISYSENNNNSVYSANLPSINSNGPALKKDNILDYRTKRINTINKWKNTIKMSAKKAELPKFDSQNKDREFSINKTSQLLNFFQKPIKEKNIKTLNLYENILSEFGLVNSEIRFFMLQFIYILQLGLIYNDLIQNLFSEKIFNIETFLIQKKLYEKQGLIDRESVLRNEEISYMKNESFDQNDFLHKSNLSSNAKEGVIFNNYSPDLKIETVGSSHLINKINKNSPIDLYIKANLQRMLYKKIIMHSIVKTWQKIYKKAYIKAMYKTIYYFLQTNQMVDSKQKLRCNFLRNQTKQNKKFEENSKEITNNGTLNNFDLFFHYYKINKMYASKTSLKYLKNIIRLVKSYFKKHTLLTLQNIKQPIFNLHLQNTKNYTKIFHRKTSKEKNIGGPASSAFVGKFSNLTTNTLVDKKVSSLKLGGLGCSHVDFCYTYIPIPYSIPQLINKKSEEMTDLLSLDISSLVDLLAENGFIAPLVVGKFFEQTRYSTISNYESSISMSNSPVTQIKPNQIQTNENLSYKRQLFILAKNLLKENQNDISFKYNKFLLNKREENSLREFSKKQSDLLDGFSSVSAEFIPTHLFRTSKLKTDISKLLSFRLLKQPYLDLYSLNNGKYPIKNNNVYSSYMNLPITFASEKDNFITKTEYKKEKQIKENYAMKELLKNSLVNNNRSRVLENIPRKRLYNNVYTLSHRERWGSRVNEGKDWQIFLLYNTAVSNSKDQPIFAYKERISLTSFNSQIYRSSKNLTSSQPQNSGLITSIESSIARSSIRADENRESARSFSQNKQPYGALINNSFFSGPGIIQQLLSELTFSEMKKLDKQNRLLLYVVNKSIFKLKKHIKIFIYDKASQIEMRELCKKRDLLIRRTKLVRKLFRKDSDPSSMILTVLPVLPPDLRPIVKMGGQIAASDLNRFYQRVIYRNDRLKKFLKDPATSNSYEMKYAQRLLQEAVDNLIQNSQSSGEKDSRGRALKSLSDILKGKQGRFRQFLLGKRVDYSGRSVIVVGPKLKLYQCGIPVEMALELYLPFLLKIILNKNYAKTVVGAKALIKNNRPLALELLREIMQVSPVLLNRAPTLHRLGFQAFVPKLVEGRAILLHPLVCSSFNADFDGDQMAVHVPITIEARAEAWKLMLSRNNMLSPATGDPLSIPSQDMVLGCYYLTTNSNKATLSLLRGSGFFFTDLQKVLYQYDLQQIDLHALVWVKWSGLIENGNDQEEPLEIRLSTTGHWQELSYNYIRHFDYSSQLIHQYMSTTPGRILFYSLLQSI